MTANEASTSSPAHEQLRSSTHHLHILIDSRFDITSISSPAAYAAFLLANWPLASIEAALESAGIHRILRDWDQRRRRNALADDLGQYGILAPAIGPLSIDSDDGALLGWSYVLEGSRLGAAMILRTMPGGEIVTGTQFLRHGAGQHLWQSYKATLSGIDRDPSGILKACSAAKLAFEYFLQNSQPAWDGMPRNTA